MFSTGRMSRTESLGVALAALGLALVATASQAVTVRSTRVASGLNRPIYVTAPSGDSRLFIMEQRGVIKILQNGNVLATPFLDIDTKVTNISGNDERGLLGLVFHPDYATNGYFYVDYTRTSDDATIVARYHVSADPNVADAASETILMVQPDVASNHNGGCLQFGPDGYLYIGWGDGGGAGDTGNRAQNPLELWGKMLRIDVDSGSPYAIPPDNPFVGNGSYRAEIWALGYRNPWRYCFDTLTGDMYIGDVGQNTWEEVDFEPANTGGRNYGWRLTEGNHCYNPSSGCDDGDPIITYPIHEYSHGSGCSITGGFVYRGSAISGLGGTYFFADWCTPTIWSFRYDGTTLTEFTDRTAQLAPGGGQSITNIASFGMDGFGEIYIMDRGSGANGEVFKIIPDAAAAPMPGGKKTGLLLTPGVPNPFSGSTRLTLRLDSPSRVELSVLDLSGRLIRDLGANRVEAGEHVVLWDGADANGRTVPAGVYFVRASNGSGSETETQRVQLIR